MGTQLTKAEILEWHERALRSLEGRRKGISRSFPGAKLSEQDYNAYTWSIGSHFTELKREFNKRLGERNEKTNRNNSK